MTKYKIAINEMATGKLPQGDPRWSTFNDSFVNTDVDVLELANAIYTGHAYTTQHTGRRNLENFDNGQHLAIDMDTDDERSALETLMRHPLVMEYGSLLHTTPSHTDDAPRARVVFLLDEVITDAAAYSHATNFLMTQFDGADTVCKDASRFFYGAANCEIELPDKTLPMQHLRTLFSQMRKADPSFMREAMPQPSTPDNVVDPQRVERMRQAQGGNVPADEFEKVRTALLKVDPMAMDYRKWIAILAALHDEFGDAALPLAESWARGKPGEVRGKWKSFGNYSGNPATVASIIGLAKAM